MSEKKEYSKLNEGNGKQKPDTPKKPMKPFKIYKFVSNKVYMDAFEGAVFAVIAGLLQPISIVLVWRTVDYFKSSELDELVQIVVQEVYKIFALAVAMMIVNYRWNQKFESAANATALELKYQYTSAMFSQSASYFDQNNPKGLTAPMMKNALSIKNGLGDKYGQVYCQWSIFLFSLIVAFYKCARLSLFMLLMSPVSITISGKLRKIFMESAGKSKENYKRAGIIAEETISGIKTVKAFHLEQEELDKYEEELDTVRKNSIRGKVFLGLGVGSILCIYCLMYSLVYYYGSSLLASKATGFFSGKLITVGDVTIAVFCIHFGMRGISMIMACTKMSADGTTAATEMIDAIQEATSYQKEESQKTLFFEGCEDLRTIKPNIKFNMVSFSYPSSQHTKALDNVSLEIRANETVALVGESGSGKSTIAELIQKFYEPQEGSVTFDGKDVQQIETAALKTKIAVVHQEPVLFAATIRENILLGKPSATEEEIRQVCLKANALEFITSLPDGFNTFCGEGGAQLSGGQKQRIAIARALIRNPILLILDEATSALDLKNESEVQKAISALKGGGITQIIIAHRLSTIRDADRILVLSKGKIVEQGDHESLLSQNGLYSSLCNAQNSKNGDHSPSNGGDSVEARQIDNSAKKTPEGVTTNAKKSPTATKAAQSTNQRAGFLKFVSRIWSIVRHQKTNLLIGFLASIYNCFYSALFSLFLGFVIGMLAEEKYDEITPYCYIYAALGVTYLIGYYLQEKCLSKVTETLSCELRLRQLKAIFKMPCQWFDDESHQVGALVTQLEAESTKVQKASEEILGSVLQYTFNFVASVTFAFFINWRIALLTSILSPLYAFVGLASMKMMGLSAAYSQNKFLAKSASVFTEGVNNFKTLTSLDAKESLLSKMRTWLDQESEQNEKISQSHCWTWGFGQASTSFFYAACFYGASYLMANGWLTMEDLVVCILAVSFGAQTLGMVLAKKPIIMAGWAASDTVFEMLAQDTPMDPFSKTGTKVESVKGKIEFKNISFSYPSRPDVRVLKNISFAVEAQQKAALVGNSGSGKSTISGLLLQLYHPCQGDIKVDGLPLNSLNLESVLNHIALVSQEPILFNRSIEENIKVANPSASLEEVRNAAEVANVLDFIEGESNPEGFGRIVAHSGDSLSGGQKQRIAIARAILKKPSILILDEATSELDAESKVLVQAGLRNAMKGTTTLMITHDYSMIEDADIIFVLNQGELVERGTHEELMKLKNCYYNMRQGQKKPYGSH